MDKLKQITTLENKLNNFKSNYSVYADNLTKLPITGVNPALLIFMLGFIGVSIFGVNYSSDNPEIYFVFLYFFAFVVLVGTIFIFINPYDKIERQNIELVKNMNVTEISKELILLYRIKIELLKENNNTALAETFNDSLKTLIIETEEQYNITQLHHTVHQYYSNYEHLKRLE